MLNSSLFKNNICLFMINVLSSSLSDIPVDKLFDELLEVRTICEILFHQVTERFQLTSHNYCIGTDFF